MLDERDLQAIAKLMQDQKKEIMHEVVQQKDEIMHEVVALMEAYFEPKFDLLADGQKLIQEKLTPPEDTEDMRTRLDLLEAITRRNVREIEKLKKAQ